MHTLTSRLRRREPFRDFYIAVFLDMVGSIANRQRCLLETIDAIAAEIGGLKIGVRFSPFGHLYDLGVYECEEET